MMTSQIHQFDQNWLKTGLCTVVLWSGKIDLKQKDIYSLRISHYLISAHLFLKQIVYVCWYCLFPYIFPQIRKILFNYDVIRKGINYCRMIVHFAISVLLHNEKIDLPELFGTHTHTHLLGPNIGTFLFCRHVYSQRAYQTVLV